MKWPVRYLKLHFCCLCDYFKIRCQTLQFSVLIVSHGSLNADSHIQCVPMPRPCRSHAILCRKELRLCLSHLIYTVQPCLINTCRAAPMPRHDHAVLKAASQGHGIARHGHCICELSPAVQRWHVGDLPAFGFFRLPNGVPRRLSEAYHLINCRTSISDISGSHTDVNEGHGTVGVWQGCGMACMN
jgi:hypothetical protein